MGQFRAHICHSPNRGTIERILDALVLVDENGRISDVTTLDDAAETPKDTVDLRGQGVLLPGFVDLHIHAPQFPQLGEALDKPLEEWLFGYTFPLEAKFADVGYADEVYTALVDTLLANGTTTAVYFATTHVPASLRLAEICIDKGQRAFVGRVAMDDPDGCPDYYRDTDAATAVKDTTVFIDQLRALPGNEGGQVEPIITPRFIPACSDDALMGLGKLAAEKEVAVQTHCSESDWAHSHVLERCGVTDTSALDGFGLLTRRTVLAHSNFISDADMDLIAKRGAGVAHCPLSNSYFANSVFPLRHALEKSVHVGLGTDISGGPSASMLDSCRGAITSSRMLEDGVDPTLPADARGRADSRIDFREAFWLATAGGAEVMDLPVGQFKPGYQFDAILVQLPEPYLAGTNETPDPEAMLQKMLMLAQSHDVKGTWVGGRQVYAA
ncbi:MAG: guanine deaminase [Marinosulfonomonas sp.]